ncbi:MAG TPA: hypothetical protein VNV66_02750 [Pilimelia sp.]|nr:hypothetical protein [Pilimelia sp.]
MSLRPNAAATSEHDVAGRTTDPVRAGGGGRGAAEPPAPPGRPPASGGGSLTRVTANFTPRAMAALERVAEQTGDSRTDILNQSVLVFEEFLDLISRGNGTVRVLLPDGTEEHLKFLGWTRPHR